MMFYNYSSGRYEIVGDKRPDLLAEKLEDWGRDYATDDDYSCDDDYEY